MIDKLINKYLCEYTGDRYDDMYPLIDKANDTMDALSKLLAKEKIKIKSSILADVDSDAMIRLVNGIDIQIQLDGKYDITKFLPNGTIKHIKTVSKLSMVIPAIKNIK